MQTDMQTRVLITGGTSGLGLALVKELTARGARVAFVARTGERVAAVAREHDAHGIVGDVAQKHDIHRIALQAAGLLDGLDVLVNNASDLGPTPLALLGDTECEDFERALTQGIRKDGRKLLPPMSDALPAAQAMTPTERRALWTFLTSLPPHATNP